MRRQLKRAANLGFAAITVEGGLISPERLSAIASATPDQKAAADYGCPKGTTLRDEITRYFRIAQAHWQGYARVGAPTTAQTEAFVKSLLEQAFGFQLNGPHIHTQDDRRFHIAWEAKQARVPVVVAAPITAEKGKLGEGFSRAQVEFGDGPGGRIPKRSPAVLLQDWLNASEASQWGLVFAGDRVRLMRDNASLTRPAFIEADLSAILRDEMFADFTLLWLLIHASRFGAEEAPASESALERWREAGMKAGTAARERLRGNVEDALLSLGQGFLDANPQLRQRLDDHTLPMPHLFEQMLRVIYRLIFMAVAEDRELLHPKGTTRATSQLYAENYSFAYLRDRSLRRNAHDHHLDAWEGLKIVFNALANGAPLLGLPALGGLFGAGLTPDLDHAQLPNRALMAAIYKLGWLDSAGPRVRINWRDMATEELGSVYEGLLELVATREEGGRRFAFAGGAEARGNARKTSGSYYTPDSLVQCLLDSALNPVLERAEAEGGVVSILDLNIIDPACGSGHFLLGAARRMATRVAQLRDPDAPDYNAAMRDVVRNCIHGVDRNPMAIELAKVALWIETVEPGKPLGFLDANLQCGDSLLGIFDLKALEEGIPDDAYKPLTGDDKETARHFAKRNKAEKSGQGMFDYGAGGSIMPPARLAAQMDELRHLPEDTVAQVEAKRRKFGAWVNDPARYATKVACDLYLAAFLIPKVGGVPTSAGTTMIPTTGHVRTRLAGGQIFTPLEGLAVDAAMSALAFHWPLAFPEVMVSKGGFDVVLGNPPWEKANVKYEEFFQSTAPEILALENDEEREAAIEGLRQSKPKLYSDYQSLKDSTERKIWYLRTSGFLALTSGGFINYYSSFAELMLNLMRPNARAGVILQSGISTDKTNETFFRHLITENRLFSLLDFINTEKFFNIDSRVKFSLVTLCKSSDRIAPSFAFNLTNLKRLNELQYKLTYDDILMVNPNTFTCPIFTTRFDADLVKKVYRSSGPLCSNSVEIASFNSTISIHRMFNATSDQKKFRVLESRGSPLTDDERPVYEAKLVSQYDHRFSTFKGATTNDIKNGNSRYLTDGERRDTNYEVVARWMAQKQDINKFDRKYNWTSKWYLALRMITSSSNERTLIASIIPDSGSVNSLNLITGIHATEACCLIANLNTLVADYVTRTKVNSNNLNQWIIEQLPIFRFTFYNDSMLSFVAQRVVELCFTSISLQSFASEAGYSGAPFTWNDDRRCHIRAELDAFYARAYGLTRDDLRYILDPSDIMGDNCPSDTFRVLRDKEMRSFEEFKTRRLILNAWDRLDTSGEFAQLGLTQVISNND